MGLYIGKMDRKWLSRVLIIMLADILGILGSYLLALCVDEMTVTAHDFALLGSKASKIKWNPIANAKCVKTNAELEHYKDAFIKTDKALADTGKFIEQNDNISEFDIKEELERNFRKYGAITQSFTSIVAKDENSALAHYSKSSKTEIIQDGSLVLIDCGGGAVETFTETKGMERRRRADMHGRRPRSRDAKRRSDFDGAVKF